MKRRARSLFPASLLTILLIAGGVLLYAFPHRVLSPLTPFSSPTPRPVDTLSVNLPDSLSSYWSAIQVFVKGEGFSVTPSQSSGADLTFVPPAPAQPVPTLSSNNTTLVSESSYQPIKVISNNDRHVWNGQREYSTSDMAANLENIFAPRESHRFTLKALGDVILGRTVLKKMQQVSSWTLPFTTTAATTKDADITLANLECTLADGIPHPTEGMSFAVPAQAVTGLQYAGIDAVNLANNHAFNGGSTASTAMMNTLKQANIPYFGAGKDEQEAQAPLITIVKGVRIALLGYSSIIGTVAASPSRPGQSYYAAAPWGTLKETEISQMEKEVVAAKKQADLVLVYVHWGVEYTHDANEDQRTVAHRLIDAGADLILGTHPHWVQGVEWYHNKLITYSLGNFVFDQEWSTETKQGTILNTTFEGNQLISASLAPYEIEDYNQPRLATGQLHDKILNDVFTHSFWTTGQ